MTGRNVYFLTLHPPYTSTSHPVAINATIVHADTLRHPSIPQPDGGRIYRCLKEFPGRRNGTLVPLSTLTYELDGGALWPQIGDWERVTDAIVQLSRRGGCDALPICLPQFAAASLAQGPTTTVTVHGPNGAVTHLGERDRQGYLDELTAAVRDMAASGPLWPGDGLVDPPRDPEHLPYRPVRPTAER